MKRSIIFRPIRLLNRYVGRIINLTELNSVEKYFLDKTSEATYGLWNALLIVNGILVSAFSSIITSTNKSNKYLVISLIIVCAISLILIIWNYITTKWHYIEIGQRLSSANLTFSKEQQVADIKKSIRRHKLVILREYIALLLLVIEMGLVVFIVLTTKITA